MRAYQVSYLNSVLDMGRLQRLVEAEAFAGKQAYGLPELLEDLRKGLFAEAYAGSKTDVGRRNLQRAYIERMEYLMSEEQSSIPRAFRSRVVRTNVDVSQSDLRPIVKMELKQLHKDLAKVAKKSADIMQKAHLEDCVDRIEAILE